jgi:hemoglobin/transferrin/lactoferrin receptor protein
LRGIEAFWGFTLSNLDVLLTYANIRSNLHAYSPYIEMLYDSGETVVSQEGFDGARTDRTQGDTYSLLLDYYIPGWDLQLHYDFTYVSSMPAGKDLDGATLNNSKDGYNLHNVSVQWAPSGIAEGLMLTLGVDNLLDEYYASQASRTGVSFHPRFGELYLTDYEPGQNVKASIAYRF